MRQNLIFLFLFLIFGLSASDESEWESPHDWGIRSDLKRIRSLDSGVDIDTKQNKLDKPGSESDSEWENPYGWGSEGDLRSSCSVEMGIDMDAQLGVTFYKKLVNFLFKRKQHLVNEFDQNQHLIKIHLQITTEQLEKLAATENIREMDAIVWDVIELSRDGFIVEAKELIFTWLDYLHNLYLWIINSSSLLFTVLALLFILLVAIEYAYFKWNIILILCLNLLGVSLFYEYCECNRQLEYEQLLKVKEFGESNPCIASSSWYWSSSVDPKKCSEYMRLKNGHNRLFCSPTEVLSDFYIVLLMKPLKAFLVVVKAFVTNTVSEVGFLYGVPIVGVMLFFLTYIMRDVIKQSFKFALISTKTVIVGSESVSDDTVALNQKMDRLIDKLHTIADSSQQRPQIVQVNLKIDSRDRGAGDYVQMLRADESDPEEVEKDHKASKKTEELRFSESIEVVGDSTEIATAEATAAQSELKPI